MTKRILTELAEIYPQVSYDPDDLAYSTEKYYQAAGRQFVIIIDEWDAVFRIRKLVLAHMRPPMNSRHTRYTARYLL